METEEREKRKKPDRRIQEKKWKRNMGKLYMT